MGKTKEQASESCISGIDDDGDDSTPPPHCDCSKMDEQAVAAEEKQLELEQAAPEFKPKKCRWDEPSYTGSVMVEKDDEDGLTDSLDEFMVSMLDDKIPEGELQPGSEVTVATLPQP